MLADFSPADKGSSLYADVLVPRPLTQTFTYLVPPPLYPTVTVGTTVLIPFGKTLVPGAVIEVRDHLPEGLDPSQLKTIYGVIDRGTAGNLGLSWLELSHALAERYVAPWGQCLRLVAPGLFKQRTSGVRLHATELGRAALEHSTCPDHLRETLTKIARAPRGIAWSTIKRNRQPGTEAIIETLLRQSWIIAVASSTPPPAIQTHASTLNDDELTDNPFHVPAKGGTDDPQWTTLIADGLRRGQAKKLVLHAPWEHRLRRLIDAVRHTFASRKSVIVLVGEAAKAEWLGRIMSDLYGRSVFVLASSASSRSHTLAWEKVPALFIGTRSSIFAPVRSIGLIWVEGEEDPSFKELREPRYHVRDTAWLRAHIEQALLVLASSHPSLESLFDPTAAIHTVPTDPTSRPVVELIDLNHEPRPSLFSQRLIETMQQTLDAKGKIILFLNRKGYAHTLLCRDCGWIPRCSICTVPLAYSRAGGNLLCRYCGRSESLPPSCPTCHAARVIAVGEGTEQAETEVQRLFPTATVLRLDGDRLRHPITARELWNQVQSRAWDVVVGTQALFQHPPRPQAHMVGVLRADSGLHVPDFRAAEHTYQLLNEAIDCAFPASEGGRVILQTRFPAHHAIQAVFLNSPSRFYDEELAVRRLLNFPPACHLASLSVSGTDRAEVEAAALQWQHCLEQLRNATLVILGPIPVPARTSRQLVRQQLLIKGSDRECLSRAIRTSLDTMQSTHRTKRLKFVVDMDPIDLG
ncbi:MAG: primosomal protein N' [Nitrospira sp.]|nr:primosomal protein N' [Nitrospira sp.]